MISFLCGHCRSVMCEDCINIAEEYQELEQRRKMDGQQYQGVTQINIVKAILADTENMPRIEALGYEYVVAGNGLFIRAENAYLEACVLAASARLHGLPDVEPFAALKVPRVPDALLWRIFDDARRQLPNEAMYQFVRGKDAWSLYLPPQEQSVFSLSFDDRSDAVIDLHSHGEMGAFFSDTDDGDEQGLRFYAVIGHLLDREPGLRMRVGVYGHHWNVPVNTVFDGLGPFRDEFGTFDAQDYIKAVQEYDGMRSADLARL